MTSISIFEEAYQATVFRKLSRILVVTAILDRLVDVYLVLFRGLGQIFLQENSLTGLLFLVAICFDSFRMAGMALFCVVVGTLTAYLCKFKTENIRMGLYGFNPALIGCAMAFYFEDHALVVIGAAIGSMLSSFMMELFLRKKLPAYTFPFIAMTWILFYLLRIGTLIKERPAGPTTDYHQIGFSDFAIPSHAFGQVIFQGHIVAGLITIFAIFINDTVATMYGIIATFISVAIAYSQGESESFVNQGLASFNAVLSGIASAGKSPIDGFYMIAATIISTYFYIFLLSYGFTTLTFPFVVSMWFTVSVKYGLQAINQKLKSVNFFRKYFYSSSPINIIDSKESENSKTVASSKDTRETSNERIHIELESIVPSLENEKPCHNRSDNSQYFIENKLQV